jgi:hypothetical protein
MCLIYGLISMTVLQLAQKVKAQIVPEFGGLGDNGIWHCFKTCYDKTRTQLAQE